MYMWDAISEGLFAIAIFSDWIEQESRATVQRTKDKWC